RPFPHGLLQRLTDAGVGPGPHQPAEALDVAREDTEGARRDGAVFARCPSPPAAITHDIDPVDTSEIPWAQATDHVRQHGVHEVAARARQHAVGLERALARAQESLDPVASDQVVVEMAEETDAVERAEHVPL